MSKIDLVKEREEVIQVCRELEELTTKKNRLVSALQQACKHESVIETPSYPSGLDHTNPSRRICVVCALEEEGWGYKMLTAQPIRIVDGVTFNTFRGKFHPLTMVPVPA